MRDKIIVDSNEPQEIIEEIKDRANFNVQVKSLDQGDFLYPHKDVAIERKEASDLAQSIQDRRVKEQTTRMRAQHDHIYLVAEGNLFDLPHSNIHQNSITGQLISLAVKNGVRIIPTKNKASTGYAVNRIFERYRDGEHKEQTEYLKRHDTGEVENPTKSMLMQIDGISKQKADTLINKTTLFNDGIARFGSLVYSDPTYVKEEIMKQDGFGPKTADNIIKVTQQK